MLRTHMLGMAVLGDMGTGKTPTASPFLVSAVQAGLAAAAPPGGAAGAAAGGYVPPPAPPPAPDPEKAAAELNRKLDAAFKAELNRTNQKAPAKESGNFLTKDAFWGMKVWQAGVAGIGIVAVLSGVVLTVVKRK